MVSCNAVNRFLASQWPHARSLSSNYYLKSLLSYHVGLAGVKEILQHTFDFSTKQRAGERFSPIQGDHQQLQGRFEYL